HDIGANVANEQSDANEQQSLSLSNSRHSLLARRSRILLILILRIGQALISGLRAGVVDQDRAGRGIRGVADIAVELAGGERLVGGGGEGGDEGVRGRGAVFGLRLRRGRLRRGGLNRGATTLGDERAGDSIAG